MRFFSWLEETLWESSCGLLFPAATPVPFIWLEQKQLLGISKYLPLCFDRPDSTWIKGHFTIDLVVHLLVSDTAYKSLCKYITISIVRWNSSVLNVTGAIVPVWEWPWRSRSNNPTLLLHWLRRKTWKRNSFRHALSSTVGARLMTLILKEKRWWEWIWTYWCIIFRQFRPIMLTFGLHRSYSIMSVVLINKLRRSLRHICASLLRYTEMLPEIIHFSYNILQS